MVGLGPQLVLGSGRLLRLLSLDLHHSLLLGSRLRTQPDKGYRSRNPPKLAKCQDPFTPRLLCAAVDAGTLVALQFDLVLERLAAATATPYGNERALDLRPTADAAEVAERQGLTDEAVVLLDHAAEPPLQGIPDIREAVERAARGGVLAPRDLHDTAMAIDGALRARGSFTNEVPAPPRSHVTLRCSACGRVARYIAGAA